MMTFPFGWSDLSYDNPYLTLFLHINIRDVNVRRGCYILIEENVEFMEKTAGWVDDLLTTMNSNNGM